MDLTQQVDGYCERLGPEYWAEPVNAVTNLAFIVAAWIMWRRCRGQNLPLANALCAVLAIIGVGSWLFHTHAQVWAGIADTLPIALYILLYIYAVNRDVLGLRSWRAVLATAAFFPYAALVTPVFQSLPFFNISSVYWVVPLLIGLYAIALMRRERALSRGLLIGAAILCLSLTFRSLDMSVCTRLPMGTHFMWHILNALMLGWMIEVYRRYMQKT